MVLVNHKRESVHLPFAKKTALLDNIAGSQYIISIEAYVTKRDILLSD